jgi:phosphoserine phosphatase
MDVVLTLVAAPSFSAVADLAAQSARRWDGEIVWLDPGRAADLAFATGGLATARAQIAAQLADQPVDWALQPRHGRRKKLLVGDMDSTFITVECIDVLAARAGLGEAVAAITQASIRGERDFSDSLRERVALLGGASVDLFEETWREDIAMMAGGKVLLATMARHGATTALVSGGFTWFTERVAATLGFDRHRANVLEIEDGMLTGKVVEPVLDRDAKMTILGELCRELALSMSETLAVGDGANDIAMLRAAGLGVGYHPVPAAAEAADACVRHGDLTTLLYFQGYARDRFVGA